MTIPTNINGVSNGEFGFNIVGTNNYTVVVVACANLANPVWTPFQTLNLSRGSSHFSEPIQSNIPGRYYSLAPP